MLNDLVHAVWLCFNVVNASTSLVLGWIIGRSILLISDILDFFYFIAAVNSFTAICSYYNFIVH